MSGWDNSNQQWQGNYSQQQTDWQPHTGGSAGGYSYFNHGNNSNNQSNQSQTPWGYGTQKWEYQPPAQMGQSWSTVADDEWGFNNNNTTPAQQPIGWRNNTEQNNSYNTNAEWESTNRNDSGDSKRWGPPPSKRARNSNNNEGNYRNWQRNDWSYNRQRRDYDYNSNQDYNDNSQRNNQRWQGEREDWTEDYYEERDPYYTEGGGNANDWSGNYNDWNQVPSSRQGSGWKDDYYNEEDAYAYEYDFGGGYEGGYEDPDAYHEDVEPRPLFEGQEQWHSSNDRHSRSSYKEHPIDRILYKKHRLLSQARENRRGLVSTVRNVMLTMKDSSITIGNEFLNKDLKIKQEHVADMEEGVTESETGPSNEGEPGPASDSAAGPTNEDETKPVVDSASDHANKDKTQPADENIADPSSESATKPSEKISEKKEMPPQDLIGVVRVGPAKRKLLSSDATNLGAELVAVYKKKPTKTGLNKLADLIQRHIKKADKITITADEENEVINVRAEETVCVYPITISFTSPEYGTEFEAEIKTEGEEDTTDLLSKDKCALALAKIRRVRWSAMKDRGELELPVVRIFLDLATQATGWKHLKPYPTEVLVHTVVQKLAKDVRETELTFSRVFTQCIEVLAEGLLLKGGPGLKDPCETQPTDVFNDLESQQAEDLTKAAQHALRLISFENIRKLLNMES